LYQPIASFQKYLQRGEKAQGRFAGHDRPSVEGVSAEKWLYFNYLAGGNGTTDKSRKYQLSLASPCPPGMHHVFNFVGFYGYLL